MSHNFGLISLLQDKLYTRLFSRSILNSTAQLSREPKRPYLDCHIQMHQSTLQQKRFECRPSESDIFPPIRPPQAAIFWHPTAFGTTHPFAEGSSFCHLPRRRDSSLGSPHIISSSPSFFKLRPPRAAYREREKRGTESRDIPWIRRSREYPIL